MPVEPSHELATLPGLGGRTAQWLVAIGVTSVAELWVLEALRLGCDWRDVPRDRKADLRRRADAG